MNTVWNMRTPADGIRDPAGCEQISCSHFFVVIQRFFSDNKELSSLVFTGRKQEDNTFETLS